MVRQSLVFGTAALAGLAIGSIVAVPTQGAPEPVIRVMAERYHYIPDLITLKKGKPVVFELISLDRVHGFKVPDLGIRADVSPDKPIQVRVTPQATGRFTFLCDIFCGSDHEEMNGLIVVED